MSDEEQRREPEYLEEQRSSEESEEPVYEAGGSPGDPASLDEESLEEPEEKPEPETDEPDHAAAEERLDSAEQELAELREELEAARRERDEHLDSLRRLKAEFENARKRQEKERERILQTASERLVLEILPILDNFDRALETEGDVREGVRATRDQLVEALGREGLAPVASDGQHFDPNVHEAVMSQPSEEHEEGTILQTYQRGYLLGGKPIRPARVVVAQ